MSIPGRLSLVTLGVADVRRSKAFYIALGWEPAAYPSDSIAFFKLAAAHLALYERSALARDAGLTPSAPGGFGGIALAINVESADRVDAAIETALSIGGKLLKAPVNPPWGGRAGYFADPDGHPWEVAYVPQFPLGADERPQLP